MDLTRVCALCSLQALFKEHRHRSAVADRHGVSIGQRVVIVGLQKQPELNGSHGTVLQFDEESGRYKVHISWWPPTADHNSSVPAQYQVCVLHGFLSHLPFSRFVGS